jgi:hypothetical protein
MYPNLIHNPQQSGLERANAIATIVLAVCAVISLLIVLWGNETNLPSWFVYVLLSLVILGFGLLVFKPAKRIITWMRSDVVVKSRFSQLMLLAQEFQGFVQNQRIDTIVWALGNLQNRQEAWRSSGIQNIAFAQLCDVLTGSLIWRIQDSSKGFRNFQLTGKDFCSLVLAYNRLYYFDVINILKQKQFEGISPDDKRDMEAAREKFSAFLDRFDNFCKETNQAFRAKVFDYYFERPKPL